MFCTLNDFLLLQELVKKRKEKEKKKSNLELFKEELKKYELSFINILSHTNTWSCCSKVDFSSIKIMYNNIVVTK
jgi:hypothetical protein